jgi:sulfur-carrier protein
MSIVFVIPGPLRELTGFREQICVEAGATSLSQALSLLWAECPAIRDRVITERGDVRTHVNIFVDGEDIRYSGGLETPVRQGSEVVLMAAVSGG